MILLTLVFACGTADPASSSTSSVVTSGDCEVDLREMPGVSGADLVHGGPHSYFQHGREFGYYEVVRDAASYVSMQTEMNLSLPDVSFPERMAVVVWEANDSCAFDFREAAAYDILGVPHVIVEFDDSSGGCEEACPAPGGAVAVVTLPGHLADPTICRNTWDACAP